MVTGPNGEGRAELGSVIVLSAEDDAADTIIPRLTAAGAELSRDGIREPRFGDAQYNESRDSLALGCGEKGSLSASSRQKQLQLRLVSRYDCIFAVARTQYSRSGGSLRC
jgi:hypothetical protein